MVHTRLGARADGIRLARLRRAPERRMLTHHAYSHIPPAPPPRRCRAPRTAVAAHTCEVAWRRRACMVRPPTHACCSHPQVDRKERDEPHTARLPTLDSLAPPPFDWPRRSARCCTMASATPSARRARCASSHGPYDWRATASKKAVRASSLPVRPRSPNTPREPLPPSSASSAAAWSKASNVDISWSGLRGEGQARSVERDVHALWVEASCGWVDCELGVEALFLTAKQEEVLGAID